MKRPHQNQISDDPHVLKQEKKFNNLKFSTVEWARTKSHCGNKVIMTDWLMLFHHLNKHGAEPHLFLFMSHTAPEKHSLCQLARLCARVCLSADSEESPQWHVRLTTFLYRSFPHHSLSVRHVISFLIPAHSLTLSTHLISFPFRLQPHLLLICQFILPWVFLVHTSWSLPLNQCHTQLLPTALAWRDN